MKIMNRKKYMLPSVHVIIMCMACFVGTAWAWYNAETTATVEDISTATYGVKVEVQNEKGTAIDRSSSSDYTQSWDLTSNSSYSVKLTGSGVASTGYCVVSFVDHVTNETQRYYTPPIAPGSSFKFTYCNGVFETDEGVTTLKWDSKVKSTKDVLTVETYWGAADAETMKAGAVIGRAAVARPAAEKITTNWNAGYVASANNSNANKIVTSVNYSYTDVITISKKGTKVTFTDSDKANGQASAAAYVVSSWKQNESGEWEIDLDGTNIAGDETVIKNIVDDKVTYTYITSKDNECIRLCYQSKGATQDPAITSEYSGEISTLEEIALTKKTNEWIEMDKLRAYYPILEGKTVSVIGDSYLAGKGIDDKTDIWPNMLAAKYNMTFHNYGINGSTISNYAGSNYNPMVDRYDAIAENNPDIIVVEGGRNDYNQNVPMGKDGSLDTKTVKGATRFLITKLQERFPNALIIGVTCWEVGGEKNDVGYYCSDYGRAFIKVCEDLGVPYINAMDSDAMGVYMTNASFRSRFCISAGDVSHLNEKGMKLVLPAFEGQISKIYEDFIGQKKQ